MLHNTLNWASRPATDLPLTGKAIAVMVATRGARLGHRSLTETTRILGGFGNIVIPGPEVVINNAPEHFTRDATGAAHLNDPVACDLIASQLAVLTDLLKASAARTLGESLRRNVASVWW